jgi:hypothetical protein
VYVKAVFLLKQPLSLQNTEVLIASSAKNGYIRPMHFSRQISQLHSTFSLLAALLLRRAD